MFFFAAAILKRWIAADFLPLRRAELEDVVRMLMYFIISVVAGVEECQDILRFLKGNEFLFPVANDLFFGWEVVNNKVSFQCHFDSIVC